MTAIDWKQLDPFQPNLTREHIDARLAEVARTICASTRDHRPDWRELDVDADTQLDRPRLSRAASKAAMRPVQDGPFDEYGYSRTGTYDVGQDGRWSA